MRPLRTDPLYDPQSRTLSMMQSLGQCLLASISAVLAWAVTYWLSSLLLLFIDSNYHDGFAALGGFVIGLVAAALAFRAVWRRRSEKG